MLRTISVVVVGLFGGLMLLVALAGSHGDSKAPGYVSAMRSDLKNLVTTQEAYFFDHQRYFAGMLSSTDSIPGVADYFAASRDVTITVTAAESEGGWHFNAVATHPALDVTCAVYVGERPQPPATVESEPGCTKLYHGFRAKLRCVLYRGTDCL